MRSLRRPPPASLLLPSLPVLPSSRSSAAKSSFSVRRSTASLTSSPAALTWSGQDGHSGRREQEDGNGAFQDKGRRRGHGGVEREVYKEVLEAGAEARRTGAEGKEDADPLRHQDESCHRRHRLAHSTPCQQTSEAACFYKPPSCCSAPFSLDRQFGQVLTTMTDTNNAAEFLDDLALRLDLSSKPTD
jgi:hypothetical protein